MAEELRARVKPGKWQVVLKRQMYRAACRVAEETGAEALITGESMGQVSSQTLGNLQAIECVADRPVLRPLIGWDKTEIIAEAQRIGTAPLSERVRETFFKVLRRNHKEHPVYSDDHPYTKMKAKASA